MAGWVKRWFPWFLAALFLGGTVTFGLLWMQARADQAESGEVKASAEGFITALTNFSAATIETDTAEIKSYGVGDFLSEAETFFGEEAVAAIQEADAAVAGETRSVFVQEISGSEASVFAVSELTISNASIEESRSDLIRLDIGMIETADGWKVNRVAVMEAPGEDPEQPPAP